MLTLSNGIIIKADELMISAMRSQGAGGQNVNKVASAIHLRFDIGKSSLPEHCKQALLSFKDQRITKEGVIVIKAQRHRTQEKNKQEALERLQALLEQSMVRQKVRRPTKPSKAAKQRRLDNKSQRSRTKALRGPVKVI